MTYRGVEIEIATERHSLMLSLDLRDADRQELARYHDGARPFDVFQTSIAESEIAMAARVGERVLAIWGLQTPGISNVGYPWLYTGSLIERHRVTFLRGSRLVLRHMLRIRPKLAVLIDADYDRAMAWAHRVGFVLSPSQMMMHGGCRFVPARMMEVSNG